MNQLLFSIPKLLDGLLTCPAAVLDTEKRIIDINAAAEGQFFCCAKNELIGESLKKYIANFDHASSLLIEQHQLFYFHPATKKNYTLQLDAFPSAESAQFYVFQAKKAVEYEYEELKHSFDAILNNLPGSVYWKDTEGRYLGCNRVVAKMAGFENPSDLVGKTDRDLCWYEFVKDYEAHDLLVMQTDKQVVREESIRLASGETLISLSYKMPLKDRFGKVLGIIGTSLDITQLKKMEASLIDAKEKAEVANRAKTEFLANMSHDVKTPLTGVVTMADIMVHDNTARAVDRERAEIIFSSGQQIVSLFNSCLDLSKMEMEEWTSKTETFSLNQLLKDIYALFAPKALSNNLLFNIECDETLPKTVEGHRESLYRVLLNLVGNAIKFTERGSVSLRALNVNQLDEQHVNVEFQVQDTGMGIPEDKHEIIFEKLHRLTPSYASKIEGSGMGLYIVDQYIKRMGGDIQVKSKVGWGSTFIVSLPLKIVTDATLPIIVAQPSETFTAKTPVNNDDKSDSENIVSTAIQEKGNSENLARVLLVEDTPMIQFVTKSLLTDAGFSIDIASSGEEAVEMFLPEKYSLVYMDIGLPVMNGYETSLAIRAKEKLLNAKTKTPIIALTGHGAVDVQAFCSDAGMQGILSKPLSREQAEKVWQRYGKQEAIHIPGLTILENDQLAVPEKNILDIAATTKLVGSKEVAGKLVSEFIKDLETQFLPHIKMLIAEHKNDELKFLLHQKLGSLAYVKAHLLEKKLFDLHTSVHNGSAITQDIYRDIEQEVLKIVKFYQKIEEK